MNALDIYKLLLDHFGNDIILDFVETKDPYINQDSRPDPYVSCSRLLGQPTRGPLYSRKPGQ